MLAQLFSGRAEGAVGTGLSALEARTNWPPMLRVLACCQAAAGQSSEFGRLARLAARLREATDALRPFRDGNRAWAARLIS